MTGRAVRSRKVIRRRYLRSWFLVDLIACFPSNYIQLGNQHDDSSGYHNLKLVRALVLACRTAALRTTIEPWLQLTEIPIHSHALYVGF
eukprot:COSAG01_NODE_3921_length_5535_cov_44.878933_7_plen_89_part_00